MFKVDYKDLSLSFNEFHNVKCGDMPRYGEFCLLEESFYDGIAHKVR
jgi:hypothetical protein